jgi:hypothetical protein
LSLSLPLLPTSPVSLYLLLTLFSFLSLAISFSVSLLHPCPQKSKHVRILLFICHRKAPAAAGVHNECPLQFFFFVA